MVSLPGFDLGRRFPNLSGGLQGAVTRRRRVKASGAAAVNPGRGALTSRSLLPIALGCLGAVVSALTLCAPALALTNPERHYEMVSPIYKGGYGARKIKAVAPDGESVAFESVGAFAGDDSAEGFNVYQASRSASGWSTESVNPPASVLPSHKNVLAVSPSLSSYLWEAPLGVANTGRGESCEQTEFCEWQYFLTGAGGLRAAGPPLKQLEGKEPQSSLGLEGVSQDLCHAVIRPNWAILPAAVGAAERQLYDVSAGCDGEAPSVKLVDVNNSGGLLSPTCRTALGSEGLKAETSRFDAVSADGAEIFFSVDPPGTVESRTGCADPQLEEQLYLRLADARTLEISQPLEAGRPAGGCAEAGAAGEAACEEAALRPRAEFAGASEDGSVVYFTTTAPLDPASDHDSATDLYVASIGCAAGASSCAPAERTVTSLTQASHDPTEGQAAEVQGVVAVAPDGSRAYFVARGVLSGEGPYSEGAQSLPLDGADNLYLYERDALHPEGDVVFVADLCSGPERSGSVADARCPADIGGSEFSPIRNDTELFIQRKGSRRNEVQTAGAEGDVLVLTSYGRLLDGGPEADADDAQDVYRFDAATRSLVRVSLGEAGADADGNQRDEHSLGGALEGVENADAYIQPLLTFQGIYDEEAIGASRAVSEDGSRIVFSTAAPLSPQAFNGTTDVYEWHEGAVSLISSGLQPENDESPVITPSGNDVFFITAAGLVPQDTDGAPDVYDARLGAVPPAPLAAPEPCRGDACQGPLTNPAALLVPGSAVQAPVESPSSTPPHSTKPSPRHKAHRRKRRRRDHSKPRKRGANRSSPRARDVHAATTGRGRR